MKSNTKNTNSSNETMTSRSQCVNLIN
jgi:hypothetical protein